MNLPRRQAISRALVGGMATLLPIRLAAAQPSMVSAASYLNGGLKGFQIDNVRSRGGNVPYFDALATTGANVGRIFFSFKKCQSCVQYGRSPVDVEALHRILDWMHTRNLKLVVAAEFDDADKPFFWAHSELRKSVVDNWQWFAREFRNHPAIAGLDLMNEPNPPWQGGKLAGAHQLWRPLAEQAISAIRAEGCTLPIIYEGVGGGSAIGFRDLVPFDDPQVVYSLHVYTPHEITHQGVGPAWQRSIPYPAGPEWQLKDAVLEAGSWDRKRLEAALKDVVAFQTRHKRPIFVGEFSCVRWAPNGSARRYVADCLAIFKQYGWSWCYHDFRGWPGWDPEIDSEDRAVTTRSSGAPMMEMIRSQLDRR
jgi:endoglucanase